MEMNFDLNQLNKEQSIGHLDKDVKVSREPQILEQVVCVGGLSGTGKTLLAPIVGTLDRVEIQKFNYVIEHICELRMINAITPDVSSTLIRMYTDLDIYNVMMSRELNFRYSDLSSPFKNPKTMQYVKRLFQAGDEEAYKKIQKEKPILQLNIHNLLALSGPLFEALGDRMSLIEMVRHPLYMLNAWYSYFDRYSKDPRDFNLSYRYKDRDVPFFVRGWEEKYLNSCLMDNVIYGIEFFLNYGEKVLQSLPKEQQEKVLLIPFEIFVKDPYPYLERMEQILDSKRSSLTTKEMKKQKVPRKMIADGVAHKIYKKYDWQPSEKGNTEVDEMTKRRNFALEKATPEAMKVLDSICAKYEEKFSVEV